MASHVASRRMQQKAGSVVSKRLNWLTLVSTLLAWTLLTPPLRAQSPSPTEYQIKAACLYNFAKFIEWPAELFPNDSAPFVYGILGEDPFNGALEQVVKGKTINGRRIEIKKSRRIEDLRSCHILFISPSEKKRLHQIAEVLDGTSVLTVGEWDQFAAEGEIINFVMEENEVHFEINLEVAERARLRVSSKLVTLARVVRNAAPGR